MFRKLLRRQQGFTLLELLIVIVIIGILAIILVPALSQGPKKGRDAARKADLHTVQVGLEQYFADNASYPKTLVELNDGTAPNGTKYLPSAFTFQDQQSNTYSYTPAPGTCTSAAKDCKTYSLNATWETGAPTGYPLTQQSS